MSIRQHFSLSILQYNVQKKYDVMNLLLRNKKTWELRGSRGQGHMGRLVVLIL
jgi:hypothetical protein